jgi:hypothetical protein
MQRDISSHYSGRGKQGYNNNVNITKSEGACSATMQTLWKRMGVPWEESVSGKMHILRDHCDGRDQSS